MAAFVTCLAALLGRVALGHAEEYGPESFLPLAVGYSWTYSHSYSNPTYTAPVPGFEYPTSRPPDSLLVARRSQPRLPIQKRSKGTRITCSVT